MTSPTLPLPCDLLVFDLDGTLVDTLLDLTATINHTLAQFGLPPKSPDEARQLIGDGTAVFLRRALGPEHEDDLDDALKIYRGYYDEHLVDRTRPYDGVVEVLEHFADKTKVVYTNKPAAPSESILCELGLLKHFAACYGDGSGLPIKPDPRGLLAICDRFGVAPDRTAMIGDGDTDVLAAQRAGIAVFAATYGFRGREALEALKPTAFFDSFRDLVRLLT